MFFSAAYHFAGYYLSLLFFGAGGLLLTGFSLLTGWLPATDATQRFFQRLIHRHFAQFVWWLGFTRLCVVRYHGFERLPPGGSVLVANHPGLMDITYLLARLPEAVCIFKPSIRRNPVLGAAARRAGYLAGDGGPDLVREAGVKVAAGNTLVVFPEGTRTPPGATLLPLKPGFVLMARRGGMPIQLVRIGWNSNILAKGCAWWKVPRLPACVDLTVGPRLAVPPDTDPTTMAAAIEAWFRSPAPGDAACLTAYRALSSTPGLPAAS